MASPQAIQAIEVKRNELRQQGIDVGAPKGETQDTIFGGGVRTFANGSIYWHPNTGAHFLGGAILQTYVNLHGPEIDPRSFRRSLGYPVTDLTSDGARQLEFAEFEFGSIYRTGGMVLGIH